MKELTKLPEKWCIKDTAGGEVTKYFGTYPGSTCSSYSGTTGGFLHCPALSGSSLAGYRHTGYTEISFSQFKKWVIKHKKYINNWTKSNKYIYAFCV